MGRTMKVTGLSDKNARLNELCEAIRESLKEHEADLEEAVESLANVLIPFVVHANVSRRQFINTMSDAYRLMERQMKGGFDA